MALILGLDLGANSIGWALLDDEKQFVVDAGSRVFEAGAESFGTTKEESKNASRTGARALRRQYFRRRKRRRQLLKALLEFDIFYITDWELFASVNPYDARVRGLDEKLELHELARAFYHICQRRGFKSNRKADKDEKENSVIFEGDKEGKRGISELRKALKEGNYRTIGEYFAQLDSHEIRIRNRFTERAMYYDEFTQIWEKQKEYYPDLLTKEALDKIRDEVIFFQRKLKSQKKKVGMCKFEPKKRRAPISHPIYQEFRMLQQVNNLRLTDSQRFDSPLTEEERTRLIEYLMDNVELKFGEDLKELKKVLRMPKATYLKINLTANKLHGCATRANIKKALGDRFNSIDFVQFENIYHTLLFAEHPDWLIDYAQRTWGFDAETAEKLAKVQLVEGYGNVSIKVLTKLDKEKGQPGGKSVIDYLKEGQTYDVALAMVGYVHNLYDEEVKEMDYLPKPQSVANPVVMVCLFQLQKVVNDLIKHYGKPDIVRIEMARDLKKSKMERLELTSKTIKQNKWHDEIATDLKKAGIRVNKLSILRYKLWIECNKTCIYTGKPIAFHQVFNGEVDIEHILPYSRTLDDSYMNKTLCFKSENHDKSNQTPYEFYQSKPQYAGIKERAKHLPYPKAKRFSIGDLTEKTHNDDPSLDGFISTQLNDTRYISRIALTYLQHICPDKNSIQVSTGQATSIIRHYLGLNSILSGTELKSRDDHRHHAVDAVVIALTDRDLLRTLSHLHSLNFNLKSDEIRENFEEPWPNFRQQLEEKINCLIVSHKCTKRVRGQLHEETLYGKLRDSFGNNMLDEKGQQMYAIRKPLKALTPNEVLSITDKVVQEAVFKRIEECGGKLDGKTKIPTNAFNEPLYFPHEHIKREIKSVRLSKPFNNLVYVNNGYVAPGGNHHISIYRDIEKQKNDYEVVSLFEAARRHREKEPVIRKEKYPGKEFLVSLQLNEMVLSGEKPVDFVMSDKSTYKFAFDKIYRVQFITINPKICFRQHNVAKLVLEDTDGNKTNPGRLLRMPNTVQETKIKVSPAGFIEYDYE